MIRMNSIPIDVHFLGTLYSDVLLELMPIWRTGRRDEIPYIYFFYLHPPTSNPLSLFGAYCCHHHHQHRHFHRHFRHTRNGNKCAKRIYIYVCTHYLGMQREPDINYTSPFHSHSEGSGYMHIPSFEQ